MYHNGSYLDFREIMLNPEEEVGIAPEIGVLRTFKHLNYTVWGALAEMVDNAIESHRVAYEVDSIKDFPSQVIVNINFNKYEKTITVLDNAAGIKKEDFPRAFQTANPAPDGSQLSEFGMGMKTSCTWFSNTWEVTTKAVNDSIERTIKFDIPKICDEGRLALNISRKYDLPEDIHYTIVKISNPFRFPKGQTITKVKRHLSSIFREFIRNKTLVLKVDNETLEYEEPLILHAPYVKSDSGEEIEWKQDINFDVSGEFFNEKSQQEEPVIVNFQGFVGLLKTMRPADSGFAMFRRGRVIEGSADKDSGYRPNEIFGSPSSFLYKRLFGEIHVTGLDVGHQKDKFVWNVIDESEFHQKLREELRKEDCKHILTQGAQYRVTDRTITPEELAQEQGQDVLDDWANAVEGNLSNMLEEDLSEEESTYQTIDEENLIFKKVVINHHNQKWTVKVEMTPDQAYAEDLIQILEADDNYQISIRLSLSHPFMKQYMGNDKKILRPIWSFAAALAIAEISTKRLSQPPSEVRKKMNSILRKEVTEDV